MQEHAIISLIYVQVGACHCAWTQLLCDDVLLAYAQTEAALLRLLEFTLAVFEMG